MLNQTYAIKVNMSQVWDKQGNRIPVTIADAPELVVTQVKAEKVDGYQAVQLGFGQRKEKNQKKSVVGHLKKSKIEPNLRYLREAQLVGDHELKVGDKVSIDQVLSVGDIVGVATKTKGTGFTGVMKRWNFAGGPRTHGQSDRERAPGSIGQGTTPGRVWKGKKMAGRDGNLRVSQLNLQVVKIDNEANQIWLSGSTPGPRGSLLEIKKLDHKDFIGISGEKAKPEPVETESETSEQTDTKEQE